MPVVTWLHGNKDGYLHSCRFVGGRCTHVYREDNDQMGGCCDHYRMSARELKDRPNFAVLSDKLTPSMSFRLGMLERMGLPPIVTFHRYLKWMGMGKARKKEKWEVWHQSDHFKPLDKDDQGELNPLEADCGSDSDSDSGSDSGLPTIPSATELVESSGVLAPKEHTHEPNDEADQAQLPPGPPPLLRQVAVFVASDEQQHVRPAMMLSAVRQRLRRPRA